VKNRVLSDGGILAHRDARVKNDPIPDRTAVTNIDEGIKSEVFA
jgi:hypothetical protein